MRRLLPVAIALSLILPRLAFAADVYPSAVYQASNQVYQPTNSIGAPDGEYTTFFANDAVFSLDFGVAVQGDITLTYQLLNFGAEYSLTWYDATWLKLATQGNSLPLGTEVTIPYVGGVPYRYVEVRNINAKQWKLDSVRATTVSAPTPAPEPPPTPAPAPPVPAQGALVKLADDGNSATTVDSAVYEIGADGKRHAFPSESVFYSWYLNFDAVQVITADAMATYPLGKNVTIRPGSHLVKITTDPNVYAVEPGGILRWITTEILARELYGIDWATRVVDVADVFFSNYTMGTPVQNGSLTTTWDVKYPF